MLFTVIWLKAESLNAETGTQERHLIQSQPNVNNFFVIVFRFVSVEEVLNPGRLQ